MIKPVRDPYKNTKVDPYKTQMNINKILRKYGITKFMWTSDFQLAMELEREDGSIFVSVVKAPPPDKFRTRRRTRQGLQNTVNDKARMRVMYYSIKSKLEGIAYGMETEEHAFMADTLVRLPDGRSGTVHQLLKNNLLEGRLSLPSIMSEGSEIKRVTEQKEEKTIEAEFEVERNG